MTVESIFKRAQMNQEIDIDTEYLAEPDAFSVNKQLHHWPADRNPFIDRMALQLKPGFSGKLPVQNFMSLVAAATSVKSNSVFEFRVTTEQTVANGLEISFEVTDVSTTTMPPLDADNSGFFLYAMNWMAANRNAFTLSVYSNEYFWVHAQ